LVLAMPITVSLKVVLHTIPELNRWAELMSLDWQPPAPEIAAVAGSDQPAAIAMPDDPGQASTVIMTGQEFEAARGGVENKSARSVL
jgi:AI-2 transport protein TqsA